MPTTYTHYAFGQDVKNLLPDRLANLIDHYEDYYNIGVHGPDILFYYHALYKNTVNQYGVKVHNEPMSVFLSHAFTVFSGQKHKKAAFAYLAGFMTHFILDSTCHPYIRERIDETGVSHAEIERDWDSVMMERDHLNPHRHKVTGHIHARPGICLVIAPYFDMKPSKIQTSLFDMKLILDHIFRTDWGIPGHLAAAANTFILKKMNYQHYFAKSHINPKNIETIRQLDVLYQSCRTETAHRIIGLYHALAKDDCSYSGHQRFQRIFS